MMQNTRHTGLSTAFSIVVFGTAISNFAYGSELSGIWKFEKSRTYGETAPSTEAPPFNTFTVQDNKAIFSKNCIVAFSPEQYFFSDVFQPMSKAGITETALGPFLLKEFNLPLSKTDTVFYLPSPARKCARPVIYFFHIDKKIIIPVGEKFYSYSYAPDFLDTKVSPSREIEKVGEMISGYKLTPLPMNFDMYFSTCRLKIIAGNRRPQTTEKCAPDYFPYVADPKTNDTLMKLVGNHDYAKGGSEYASGFSPPFRQKTAATFLVFPPMKQAILVRVDDFEVVRDEKRDVMSGVYLSIVNGKVIDQIADCDFNGDYVCMVDERPVAKLLENGKFQRLR